MNANHRELSDPGAIVMIVRQKDGITTAVGQFSCWREAFGNTEQPSGRISRMLQQSTGCSLTDNAGEQPQDPQNGRVCQSYIRRS